MQYKSNLIIYLLVIFLITSLTAQDKIDIENDYQAKENDWRFIISPYALLAGNATDVGGDRIRQSFTDLASLTNFGFMLNTQVMYKKWVLLADGTYANLGVDTGEGIVQVGLDIKQYMLDLRLGYNVYTNIDTEGDVIRGWALEVNAGAKHWKNDVTIDYKIQLENPPPLLEGSLKEPLSWWDMMLGVKARIFLSRSVLLGLYASGGGFGIGNSSKFSWDFSYTNTFKVSDLISITAGYRTLRYTRVDGEGDQTLETKVSSFGPLLGVSFIF